MIIVMWTAASAQEATTIARYLVEQKLVACANLFPNITSIYGWQGNIETAPETKVLLKTTAKHYHAIQAYIAQESSYDIPEITYLNVAGGNAPYLDWIEKSL